MIVSTACRRLLLVGTLLGTALGMHAQAGGPGGQSTAQTLSQHAPSAAEIMAAHDENVAQYIAARAARLKRRRIDLYKHLEHDSQTLQQVVAKLNADLKAPAGTRPTQQQAKLAVKDAQEVQKISGEIYKRMVQ